MISSIEYIYFWGVYFRDKELDVLLPAVKIGRSWNPKGRVGQLRGKYAKDNDLAAVSSLARYSIPTDSAPTYERDIHWMMRHYEIAGGVVNRHPLKIHTCDTEMYWMGERQVSALAQVLAFIVCKSILIVEPIRIDVLDGGPRKFYTSFTEA